MFKKNNNQKNQPLVESTQKFLEIDFIKDDILILKDGSLHAVLMTSSINMELRSQEEQEITISSYQNALNSIGFPVQILVQSRKVDLTSYMAKLEESGRKQENDLLKEQTEDYIYFLRNILSSVNVMDKRFFVIVPYYPSIIAQGSKGVMSLLGFKKPAAQPANANTQSYDQDYKQLRQRTEIVVSLLGEMGITATQLPTEALIELFYSCYNPETAGHEHIKNLDSLGAKYISTRNAVERGDVSSNDQFPMSNDQ